MVFLELRLQNVQNKSLPFENAEAHFWPFGPKLWGAASQGAHRMSSRPRAVPSRSPRSLSGLLPSVYWFPEGLLPTRISVSHWVLQKGLALLPTASELCAPVGGGTTHPFVSHYPWLAMWHGGTTCSSARLSCCRRHWSARKRRSMWSSMVRAVGRGRGCAQGTLPRGPQGSYCSKGTLYRMRNSPFTKLQHTPQWKQI